MMEILGFVVCLFLVCLFRINIFEKPCHASAWIERSAQCLVLTVGVCRVVPGLLVFIIKCYRCAEAPVEQAWVPYESKSDKCKCVHCCHANIEEVSGRTNNTAASKGAGYSAASTGTVKNRSSRSFNARTGQGSMENS